MIGGNVESFWLALLYFCYCSLKNKINETAGTCRKINMRAHK